MRIDFFFLALCLLSARNDLDSKYKELCNCCAACADQIRIQGLYVRPAAGLPDHRVSKKQAERRREECDVQFQNRTKVVTHIIVSYKFLSNFIILVDYL